MGKRYLWVWMAVVLSGLAMGTNLLRRTEQRDPVAVFSPQMEATGPAETESRVTMPWALEGTDLVCQGLVSYDGLFLEDGSREETAAVTGLLLQNTGTNGVDYAQIVLTRQGGELVFEVSCIPPRATVLVLEKNRTEFTREDVQGWECRVFIPGSFDFAAGEVWVDDDGENMTVTNLTQWEMQCVRVYYKQHTGAEDVFVGGITYSVCIEDLQGGECRTVDAGYYVPGYAAVVAVEVVYGS